MRTKKCKQTYFGLKTKMFLILFVSIIVFSCVFMAINISYEKKLLLDNTIQHHLILIQQTSAAFDDHLGQIDALARTIGNSQIIHYLLQISPDSVTPSEYIRKFEHARDLLQIYTINDPYIHITIFDADARIPSFSSSTSLNVEYDFTQDEIYAAFQSTPSDMLIFYENPQNYFDTEIIHDVYTLAYRLRSQYTQSPIGYLIVDISAESLHQMFASNENVKWEGTILVDGASQIIDSVGNVPQCAIDAIAQNAVNPPYARINDTHIIFTTQSDFTGWVILSVVDYYSITLSVKPLQMFVTVFLCLAPVLILLLSIFLSKYFSAPIVTLSNSMHTAETGDLTVVAPIYRNDELGMLASHFNSMVLRINTLIEKNKEAQIRELQSQMNPHFIYNTLEMIAGMSTGPDASTVRSICNHLSTMMRYNLRPERVVVLRDELSQARSYLAIMQRRFPDLFSYEIVVNDEALLDQDFGKFTLQPLVENSIKYGFKGIRFSGHICLTIGKQEDCIYCLIQDNGHGIPPEKLAELSANIEEIKTNPDLSLVKPPHGITNVFARLYMLYRERLEFHIESQVGLGTTIFILITSDESK